MVDRIMSKAAKTMGYEIKEELSIYYLSKIYC